MKRNKILLLLCMFIVSCDLSDNLFLGREKYIELFNHEYHIKGVKTESIDTIGTFLIDFAHPYLITTLYKSSNYIKLYDLETRKFIGDFAFKGDGPSEFLSFGVLNQTQNSILWAQDYFKKKLYEIDLKQSEKQMTLAVVDNIDYSPIVDPLQIFYCSDSLLLIKNIEVENGICYVKYDPISPGKKMERIYMYNYVLSQTDLNLILSLADCLKPDSKMIASLTGVLNQIDILNLEDSTKNLSVIMGKGPKALEDIRSNKSPLYDYYISLPRCNDDLIFALYRNKNNNDKKEFHVINWEGEALFRLFIDEDLRDFNIDWMNKKLYGITMDDIVYIYDIKVVF